MSDSARAIRKLENIMEKLRSPDGCPWDATQTPETLKPYLLEETYEVLEAIDEGVPCAIQEELGDLLLQIVFITQIFKEQNAFTLEDVANTISEKLIRRHPHVFDPQTDIRHSDLNKQWDLIKKEERKIKKTDHSIFAGIPPMLPALTRARKVLERATRESHQDNKLPPPLNKMGNLLAEAGNSFNSMSQSVLEDYLGEILLNITEICVWAKVDPEDVLRKRTNIYIESFFK